MSLLQRRKATKKPESRPDCFNPVIEDWPEYTIDVDLTEPSVVKEIVAKIELDVTVLITHYRTPKLLWDAIDSLHKHEPGAKILIIDNNSGDRSQSTLRRTEKLGAKVIILESNIGHGPAMDYGIRRAINTKYVLTMDSDCIVMRGGFLADMQARFRLDNNLYALGWLRYVNLNGVSVARPESMTQEQLSHYIKYVHPAASMYDTDKYLQLRPFNHAGAPCVWNMIDAQQFHYGVKNYDIWKYIKHLVAGTRRMYGGKWDVSQDDNPSDWNEKQSYPI